MLDPLFALASFARFPIVLPLVLSLAACGEPPCVRNSDCGGGFRCVRGACEVRPDPDADGGVIDAGAMDGDLDLDADLDGALNDADLDGALNDADLDGALNDADLDGAITDAHLDGAFTDADLDGSIIDADVSDGDVLDGDSSDAETEIDDGA